MSGHSKWATIKRKKAATDAKRSNMYAKMLRAVEVAAREGGGNVEANMTLASAVEKAKSFSVPNDNIERAIKRGTGDLAAGARTRRSLYEGYAVGGIALIVEALTDNRNRTAQEVRHAFTRNGGNLGEQGIDGVDVLAQGRGRRREGAGARRGPVPRARARVRRRGPVRLRELLGHRQRTRTFKVVKEALEGAGVEVFTAEITMVPQNTIPVDGGEAKQVLNLIEALEELDDVQNVYANFDIPEEVMASL